MEIQADGSLRIRKVTTKHQGVYSCAPRNEKGSFLASTKLVIIQGGSQIMFYLPKLIYEYMLINQFPIQ